MALNPIIKFTTLFGLLAVELAVSLANEGGAILDMCWRWCFWSFRCISPGARSTECALAAPMPWSQK